MKRAAPAPDWRCHGEVVFRDVLPGRVPLSATLSDGSVFRHDATAEIVRGIEILARREKTTFAATYRAALERALRGFLEGE